VALAKTARGGSGAIITTNHIDRGSLHIGHYADAVRVPASYDHIDVSGMLGLTPDGTVPRTISNEARQAGCNVPNVLSGAGASPTDIVSVRQRLTKTEDVSADAAIRDELIHHEPVSLLAVVTGLVWPNSAIEMDVIEARPAAV
jgi:2-iminobutanoate/2-iminopropanoate deaminase